MNYKINENMACKIKVRIYCRLVVLLAFFCLAGSLPVVAGGIEEPVPLALIGNWVNGSSHEWEYGFFEKFAIYDAGFWDYKQIRETKNQTFLTLERDGKQVELRVRKKKDQSLEIALGNGGFQSYKIREKGFLPYPESDTTFFDAPRFEWDTVTILGYYRHLDRLPEVEQKKLREAGKNDFIKDKQVAFPFYMDTLGRFEVKVPLFALEIVFLDWGFLNKNMYLEPGGKVFVYADAEELWQARRSKSREEYWNYERNVLFMGNNARVLNEIAYCPQDLDIRGYNELEELVSSDMEFLKLAEGDYLRYMALFGEYKRKYPTLSRKCVGLVETETLHHFASVLMQHRFSLSKKERLSFDDPAYIDYVERTFPLDREWAYFIDSYFDTFIRDYCDYIDHQDDIIKDGMIFSPSSVKLEDVLGCMAAEGRISEEDLTLARKWEKLNLERERLYNLGDTVSDRELIKQNQTLYDKMNLFLESEELKEIWTYLGMKADLLEFDTLIRPLKLRELVKSRFFAKGIDYSRIPFSERMMALLGEQVKTPSICQPVIALNETYRKIANKEITYLESLKNPEEFEKLKDAKSLFEKLIEPYKGKVIYLDIWGTWCAPCRQQMAYVGEVKKELKGEDVIFMYLANHSDEKSWKNVIKEYDLTGENVVHYRLPENQQSMLENLLPLQGYPTFILLDKEGNIANPKAPWPMNKDLLVKEIRQLLAK